MSLIEDLMQAQRVLEAAPYQYPRGVLLHPDDLQALRSVSPAGNPLAAALARAVFAGVAVAADPKQPQGIISAAYTPEAWTEMLRGLE